MKKTKFFTFLIASVFALAINAQGIIVHQGESKKVSFKSTDVQKIEFTEEQVENSTDNYVEKSELEELLGKLRDEIKQKLDRTEAEGIWKEIERILGLCKDLESNKVDKNMFQNAIASIEKNETEISKDVVANEYAISTLRKDLNEKADRLVLDKALKQIEELSDLVKELQSKIEAGGSGETNKHNGHAYVDLGLSVKWATMNVGADKPEGYGYYYAWGETEPKAVYSWDTYFDSVNGSSSNFDKYDTNKTTVLDPDNDVAHVKWGGDWRMPTKAEQDELRTKCTKTWCSKNGVNGYTVVGPNGNSLFLPAAGFRSSSDLNRVGSYGYYWSSSLDSDGLNDAFYLFFDSGGVGWGYGDRCNGRTVRPVCPQP